MSELPAAADVKLDDLFPGQPVEGDHEGVTREHGFFTSFDQTKLFWQRWSGAPLDAKSFDTEGQTRRGRIIIMHGYGEHSSRYAHVAVALVRAGYDVMAFDARGHGHSGGKEAHVSVYDEYVLDLEQALDVMEETWGDERGPLDVVGHSNGGLIALRHALRRPDRVRAFVVTSPFCGFKVKVPAWKSSAGKVMSRVWPSFGLPSELPPSDLTHREDVIKQYANDPLNRSIATSRWFTETKSAQRDLLERAGKITHPLLMLVGGADRIADPSAAQNVYHALGSSERELEVYETLYHEILNEVEWEDVMRRMLAWIEAR